MRVLLWQRLLLLLLLVDGLILKSCHVHSASSANSCAAKAGVVHNHGVHAAGHLLLLGTIVVEAAVIVVVRLLGLIEMRVRDFIEGAHVTVPVHVHQALI